MNGFIINTNQYSGNFEREMSAYVSQHPEPNYSIRETTGYYNNGFGFNFKNGEEQLALEKFKQYAIDFEKRSIAKEKSSGWPGDLVEQSIKRRTDKIKNIELMTEPHKYPAYNSVIIFFDNGELTDDLIDKLKERAYNFGLDNEIKIEKFEVVSLSQEEYYEAMCDER